MKFKTLLLHQARIASEPRGRETTTFAGLEIRSYAGWIRIRPDATLSGLLLQQHLQ